MLNSGPSLNGSNLYATLGPNKKTIKLQLIMIVYRSEWLLVESISILFGRQHFNIYDDYCGVSISTRIES